MNKTMNTNHSFRWAMLFLTVVLVTGCAGTTKVQPNHPLMGATAESTRVYFIRPKSGFRGVADLPLKISLDGKKLLALSKPKLLIVDELGYLPLEPDAAHLFFQLVSRRYETGAMLITSNRSVAEWGTVFADPVVATAILDRLLHHSHVLTIRGDSYRLRAKRKSGLIKPLAGDGPPVGSASLRPVTGETNLQPRS